MTHGDGSRELGVGVSRSAVRGFSAARLRRYRLARKANIADLADAAGVSEQTVSAWETGRAAPTPELLAKVAAELRLTVADLVPIPNDQLGLSDLRAQADDAERQAQDSQQNVRKISSRYQQEAATYSQPRASSTSEVPLKVQKFIEQMYNASSEKRTQSGNILKTDVQTAPVVNTQGQATGRIVNVSA